MRNGTTRAGIVYLSLTGNTKAIAAKIGEELASHGAAVSYYDLMEQSNRRNHPLVVDPAFLRENDLLGFGCFTAAYQPMFFFKRLLDQVGDLSERSSFVFCTYGVKFGSTLEVMRRSVARSRAVFLGGEAFACSDEVKDFALNRIYLRHDRPGESEFAQARRFADRVMANHQRAASGARLRPADVAMPRGEPLFRLLGTVVCRQEVLRRLRGFRIDEAKCARCGWCVGICPSQSLSFPDGARAPVVDANCQSCGMCFECRQEAIVPVNAEWGIKSSAKWDHYFYAKAPRKMLDDRELALLREDRFRVMKSRPELMTARGL